ncbi:hypothetical protein [Vibrio rotiferianus]|uniref:hypothetical protein n=1 Tax=Vibrio rotiferianus TaxID=190895 RepID=UPI0015F5D576|nr:hypothetical protein [Vibrio rotiferianus]
MKVRDYTVSIHKLYYKVAKESYDDFLVFSNDYDLQQQSYCSESDLSQQWDIANKLYESREISAIKSITFSAMCLEAFLYDYAVHSQSSNFLSKKLPAKEKFVRYLNAVDNLEVDTQGDIYQRIEKLFSLRNELVHFKSRKYQMDQLHLASEFHDILNENLGSGASESLETIHSVIRYLDENTGSKHFDDICAL